MSRFVVALNGGTVDQRNALTALFSGEKWELWHHFEDLWILADVPADVTSRAISEKVMPLIGGKAHLVIKIQDPAQITCWGVASKKGWEWMWKRFGKPG